jgi:hypothetical protein
MRVAQDEPRVTPAFLADARIGRRGPGTYRAPCPGCRKGQRDDALAVTLEAEGSAVWHCHRCGWSGSTRARGRTRTVPPLHPERRPEGLPAAAEAIWNASRIIAGGCVGGSYLSARGCALPHPAGDVRLHLGLRRPSGHVGPALVALVTDAVTGEPLTLHRTWIRPDGTKAPVAKPRLLWPGLPKAGGVVRLWPDEEVTLGLAVAEGLETALTAAAGFGPAWACLDAANLAGFPMLDGIECLTVVADNDPPDRKGRRAGQEAAEACARRWLEAGREVRVWCAPTEGADLNDFARAAAAC